MKIEILFPEFCNLFGDTGNVRYLKMCLPDAEFVNTALTDEPLFAREKPALIYMGPMTERTQEKVIEALMPLKSRIKELIDDGACFLFTGNAMELLFNYIECDDGRKIQGLGILPVYAVRRMMKRHNSVFLGEFEGSEITGFKSQFTMAYPTGSIDGLFEKIKGIGLNKKLKYEGIRKNNFFGTYLLGPLLVLNPPFTKYLLTCMGVDNAAVALAADVQSAYKKRLEDFHAKA